MKMKKRNLIVAALVIALGAAVYLNWQFGGDNTLLTSSTKELGAAEYVNNDTTVTSPSKTKLSSKQSNYFADARTKREQSQDKVQRKCWKNPTHQLTQKKVQRLKQKKSKSILHTKPILKTY